ncbi:hypothetical protein MMC34_007663 [Xylographa carneopallida]|nr:hypothetical protein [Xylographa carneopallida]
MDDHKSSIRQQVWSELKGFAYADSRFDFDFSEFIPDFHGSSEAIKRLMLMPAYQSAKCIFITPDNCLEELRYEALKDGKLVLMTTYAIRRGFWLLDPNRIDSTTYRYASTLDGMERVGQPTSLSDMMDRGMKIDLMVTGTGAINPDGIRFGKGHGFFDLEWAILYSIGAITSVTQAAAVVHDCQVLAESLIPEPFDTVCDVVITPTKLIGVFKARKPICGILWSKLAPGMLESIPPLQELKALIGDSKITQPGP